MLMPALDFSLEMVLFPKVHCLFSENHFFDFSLQILHGLQYLHAHGMYHGDMKLENVFVEETSRGFSIVFGDFGRAKEFTKSLQTFDISFKAVSTINYSSHEVLQGKRGPSADIYAFALMVLELFSGKQFSFGDNLTMITKNIMLHFDDAASPLIATLDPSHPLRDFLPQCWAKDHTQ